MIEVGQYVKIINNNAGSGIDGTGITGMVVEVGLDEHVWYFIDLDVDDDGEWWGQTNLWFRHDEVQVFNNYELWV